MLKTAFQVFRECVVGLALIVLVSTYGTTSKPKVQEAQVLIQEPPRAQPRMQEIQEVPRVVRQVALRNAVQVASAPRSIRSPVESPIKPDDEEENELPKGKVEVIEPGDSRLDPDRVRPNHVRVCTPHNGCHEICNEPHPIYSYEPVAYAQGSYKSPTYSRCATCVPSKAQMLWISKLSNGQKLRSQYSDQQIIQYFGNDRLAHLTGSYLPPNLDPQAKHGSVR